MESSPSSSEAQTQEVSSPPRQVLQQQEALADISEQVADPADLSTSSVVLPEQTSTAPPQGKVLDHRIITDGFIITNYNYLCNFSVEVIPSATSADQPIVPAASPRQRHEIALKQVSYLTCSFYIINT